MDHELEVIDALVDGERVDRDELKRALASPKGRDYLVDVLELRQACGEMATLPGVPESAPRRIVLTRWAAVAALVVCSLGAYAVGHYMDRLPGSPQAAPSAAAVNHDASRDPQRSAPAPTRIIRLQPGVDWTEKAGGN